ncbi:hypothetical protein BP5796_09003 [Coleophoma crateriformis]|uniref:GPR1 protein n=1 Tax=Coleophoma crateriformis TaxID=565419 RepID=A0A3D8R2Z7_9HELO|nr:hypothetical protein BP5796_09003 [Coleophoma crateriformis]
MADHQEEFYGKESINGSKEQRVGNGSSHLEELKRTATNITLTPDQFEKLYLSPQNRVSGDLRKTVGNPTPLALIGFLMCLTPLSCDLMGWRGAGGSGAAGTASYFFFGGLLMVLGGTLEFLLGNTFPFVVFSSFGAFWLSYGGTLQPFYNAAGAYAGGDQAAGLTTPGFSNSFAFFLLFMGFMCFIYMIAALRTNIVFFLIFMTLVCALTLLAGAFWQVGQGNPTLGVRLQIAGGAFGFVTCMLGWYIFTAQILASVDFPLNLPIGDLSTVFKSGRERRSTKEKSSDSA